METLKKYIKDYNKPLTLEPFTELIVKRKSDKKIICHITNEFESIDEDYILEMYE